VRLKVGILTICALLIGACGKSGSKSSRASIPASTGHFDAEGIDYTDGGDSRVSEALRERPQPKPAIPTGPNAGSRPPATPPPAQKALAKELKAFQISRYHKDKPSPQQLGTYRAEFQVFFTARNAVAFNGPLVLDGKKLKFENSADGFTFRGELEDLPGETKGEFTLSRGRESARIFYRAYKSKINVRTDRDKVIAQGSRLDLYVKSLKDHDVYAWVHNWVVLEGPSTYLVDIVNNGPANSTSFIPLLSLSGESKRTGTRAHNVDINRGDNRDARTDVKLIGNAEKESRRLFAVQVREKPEDQPEEFLLDVEMENQQPVKPPPEDIPMEAEPPQPPTPGAAAPAPVQGLGFLQVNLGTPRTQRMVQDFEKNRQLQGVGKFIAQFQRNGKRDLENFYKYSSPFRPMMEAIGAAYDVSPAFAYLTVVESAYFTGGRYQIQAAGSSTALGPFQLLEGTARELGVKVTGGRDDERRFFKPSACGAAKYVGKLVDMFSNSDSTVAILAYYQGDGGAAAAIHCSFGANAGKACASRINKRGGYTGQDYAQFKRLAKNYNYSYAEMDRLAAIPQHMRDYVNKKLAVYFISNDLRRYGFTLPGAPGPLPNNGTVTPSAPIQDSRCRAIQLDIPMS
jgi:hypothetical protein